MIHRHDFTVRAPLSEVALFHTQASGLGDITLPFMPMRLHNAPNELGEGDSMAFTLWLGPVPVRWQAQVTDVSETGFVDSQVQGPFDKWTHRHTFEEVDAKITRVVDRVEAKPRAHLFWGPVGWAMWLGLPVLFAFRGWKTRRLLEAPDAADSESWGVAS
jgi:ligand-binding SRPBCC domain-containing protein